MFICFSNIVIANFPVIIRRLNFVRDTYIGVVILTVHVQWLRLGLSEGSHRLGTCHPLHEDRDRSNFQHVIWFRISEDGSSQKLNNPECSQLSLISRTVLFCATCWKADHSNHPVQGMNCLRSLDCGFDSHSSHGCLCVFCVCVVLCVGSGLAKGWADPPFKESHRLCIGLRNWKSGQGPAKGL
jgi:hypothetical protein